MNKATGGASGAGAIAAFAIGAALLGACGVAPQVVPVHGPEPRVDRAAEQARDLAEHSSIIVRGRVVAVGASNEPMLAAAAGTVTVSVSQTLAGSEIAGDQAGRNVTVITTRRVGWIVGQEAIFCGHPQLLGASLTLVDEGEIMAELATPATMGALRAGIQRRAARPMLESLASASLVFRGTVDQVQSLSPSGTAPKSVEYTEHDPEWRVATVRVTTPLRGGAPGSVINVVFPSSNDVMWFLVPKLRSGQEALFITHDLDKREQLRYRPSGLVDFLSKQSATFVLYPVDVQPATLEASVRSLLSAKKDNK
jgi:hypothetical protein